jgi:hypothetical protein
LHEQSKFPFCPAPEENETLTSWMTRIAHANFLSTYKWMEQIGSYSKKDFDIDCPKKVMWEIHVRTGMPIAHVGDLSLKKDLLYIAQIETAKLYGCFFNLHLLDDQSHMRYCPTCFQGDEDPYFRKLWRWQFLPICPQHWCILQLNCPSCHLPLNYFRLKWRQSLKICPECGFDLSNAPIIKVPSLNLTANYYQEFLYIQNLETKSGIFLLAKMILIHCKITDPIYERLVITNLDDLALIDRTKVNPEERVDLSHNFLYIYHAISAASRFFQKHSFCFSDYCYDNHYQIVNFHKCPHENCQYSTEIFSEFLNHIKLHVFFYEKVPDWIRIRQYRKSLPLIVASSYEDED